MKIKELLERMKNSMVLESPKLRIKNGEKFTTIRLGARNYGTYADKEVISWDLCPTRIDFKSSVLYGYLVIEVKDEN